MAAPEAAVHHAAESVAGLIPSVHSFIAWLVAASIAAVLGIIVGALVDPLANHVLIPAYQSLKSRIRPPTAA